MKTIPANIQDKHILFSSLDWGMGHLTRSTVLMKQFLDQGNHISFAGTKTQCAFIEAEFNTITCHYLKGYEIGLDSSKNTFGQILIQFSKIKSAIRAEKKWLGDFVKEVNIDLIISDNRYGFYHKSFESILITHQLKLQVPNFKSFVNKKIKKWVSKFDSIWVPDNMDRRLTGELSNPKGVNNVEFIGPLCRFEKRERLLKHEVLVILSGPEPEKTNFLNKATSYIELHQLEACIIGSETNICDSYPNPTTKELGELIAESKTIISRAGYTTIMEMVALDKNAILIPTKGQFEQEYLARIVKHPKIEFKEDF